MKNVVTTNLIIFPASYEYKLLALEKINKRLLLLWLSCCEMKENPEKNFWWLGKQRNRQTSFMSWRGWWGMAGWQMRKYRVYLLNNVLVLLRMVVGHEKREPTREL